MKGAFKIATIKGIGLYVHWTFLLIVGWIMVAGAAHGNSFGQLLWSLLFLLSVFACITLHELGHALVAARFGIMAKDITLLPIGGMANIEKFPESPAQELAISVAGPVVSLVIAFLLWLVFRTYPSELMVVGGGGITQVPSFLYNLSLVNVVLAVFNLIPAFPMDGGRILRALLSFKLDHLRATNIAATAGKVIAVLFIVAGILIFNPFLPVIGVFIIFSASVEAYYLRLRTLVKGLKLNDVLIHNYNSLVDATTVQQAVKVLETDQSKYFILTDNGSPAGTINRIEIVKAAAEGHESILLRNLPKEPPEYLDGSQEVADVLEKLARNSHHIFPVMENGKLSGVVTLNHIIEHQLMNKRHLALQHRIGPIANLFR